MLALNRARLLGPIALIGATLVLAACGSSSSSDSSSAAPDASTAASSAAPEASSSAAAPTGTPIRIGYALSQSGPLASSTEAATPAAEAWADWVNASGGINGHPVEIVFADTKGDATATQAEITKLVETEKVDALLLSDAITESAVGEYLGKAGIPIIGASGYAASLWETIPNFFATSMTGATVITSEVVAAATSGAKTIGAVVCAEAASCASDAKAVIGPTAEAQGMTYTGPIAVKGAAPNYTAECLSMQEKGADVITLIVAPDTGLRVMQDCVAQGVATQFGVSSTSFTPDKFSVIDGLKMIGTLNGFPWWADAPAAQTFRDAMAQYQPDANYKNTSATTTWTSLELFHKVAGGISGDITRDSIIAGYNSVKDETLEGLLPVPVTFTAGQPSTPISCFWQWTWAAGDENPTLLPPTGASGNGATGDLATACMS